MFPLCHSRPGNKPRLLTSTATVLRAASCSTDHVSISPSCSAQSSNSSIESVSSMPGPKDLAASPAAWMSLHVSVNGSSAQRKYARLYTARRTANTHR